MATSHIRSIRVGLEAIGFGSIYGSTGLPTTAGITFTSLECERASLETFGDPAMNERAETRDSVYELPPEPDTVCLNGRIQRRTGSITLTCPLRTLGDATTIASYNALPLGQLFNSGMWIEQAGGALPATADSATVGGVNRLVAGATGNYTVGSLIGLAYGGRLEVSSVTGKLTNTIQISPALSTGAGMGARRVRMFRTYYTHPLLDMNDANAPNSVAMLIDGTSWRTRAWGCRMESAKFYLRGKQWMVDITMQAAYIDDAHGQADPAEPTRTDAVPAHFLGTYAVLSGIHTQGTTAPFELARNAVNVDEIEITYTNTLTPAGFSDNILGMSDLEITDVKLEAKLVLSNVNNTFTSDFLQQNHRTLMVGGAGCLSAAGTITPGNGIAIMIGGAFTKADPKKRNLANDIIRQELTLNAGRYVGDETASGTEASCAIFKFGMAE